MDASNSKALLSVLGQNGSPAGLSSPDRAGRRVKPKTPAKWQSHILATAQPVVSIQFTLARRVCHGRILAGKVATRLRSAVPQSAAFGKRFAVEKLSGQDFQPDLPLEREPHRHPV